VLGFCRNLMAAPFGVRFLAMSAQSDSRLPGRAPAAGAPSCVLVSAVLSSMLTQGERRPCREAGFIASSG
jgi:hypothetical protein